MLEANALGRHLVDIRRLVVFGSVTTESFPAHVVGHNENDISLLRGNCSAN